MTICEAVRAAVEMVLAGTLVLSPTPAPATPSPVPVEAQRSHEETRGVATWYQRPPGGAAAGPGLRNALGKGWRGKTVTVCYTGAVRRRCVTVRLDDWCACPGGRVIDLARADFARLADPSRGVLRVRVHEGD